MPLTFLKREHSNSGLPESSSEDLPRRSLGGFRLLRVLGTGGMATVYLGHRIGPTGASQFSAIKVMLPHLVTDEDSVQMFLDEARITSSIQHPYVCRVLDFGVDDGLPYLATEYVMGEVLSDLLKALHETEEGRIASRLLVAQVIAQACEGLHAAHEACDDEGKSLDIVHRDTAPQNIIVGYDGCVRVLDFGIARATNQLHDTQQGVFRGRFAYMAPEQMEAGRVDRRADIWSLGVMLWEGVTGRRLFKRNSINRTMRAVIADPLPPLLRSVEDVPSELLEVVERAVARDPRARFPTARKMSAELSRHASTGAPSIAAWMERLFGERAETKRRELQEAMGAVSASFPRVGGYPVSIRPVITKSGIRLAAEAATLPPMTAPNHGDGASKSKLKQMALRGLVVVALGGAFAAGLLAVERSGAMRHVQSPTASASAGPLGIVIVRTTGGAARVQVDGRNLGQSPLQIALPAGRHDLRIARGQDIPIWAPLDVQEGVTHTLDIPLE